MKRSEMLEHMSAELEEMLQSLENRPRTRSYVADRWANRLLDMLEGLGIKPPGIERTGKVLFKWEPEDEEK